LLHDCHAEKPPTWLREYGSCRPDDHRQPPPLRPALTVRCRQMRDALRAIEKTFSEPAVPYPLPDELRITVQSFLDRCDPVEDHDSQRFHDELLSLYTNNDAGCPEKLGSFLALLCLCRPALTGEARLGAWWDLAVRPTIEGVGAGRKRHEVQHARQFLQSILVFDGQGDAAAEEARLSDVFARKVLDLLLARTRVPSSTLDVVAPEDEFVASELESVLVAFGRRKPKVRRARSVRLLRC
jgi:hypothetical protein